MIKIADNLLQVAAKSELAANRVRIIHKKVFVHKMFEKDIKDVHLPCVSLGAASLTEENNRDYNIYIRPERSQYDVFLWTRASWGKRAWKSM